VVQGITPRGAVVIRTDEGLLRDISSGSLIFAD
jgi:hypothetical protein